MKGDLLHNGSNYVDSTAYQAIKNVMKGESAMEKKVGQVWKIKHNSGINAEVLIIAVNDGYCTTVQVKDSFDGYVIKGTGKTTELGKMSYTFDNAFVKYKETISEESVGDVKKTLAEILGIHMTVSPAPATNGIDRVWKNIFKEWIENFEAITTLSNNQIMEKENADTIKQNLLNDMIETFRSEVE